MDIENKPEKFKIPSQFIPISYIILVCIGYAEKAFFYEKFGINIALYLNFEEYLFIFLSIGSIFLTVLLVLSIYFSGLIASYFTLLKNFRIKQPKEKTVREALIIIPEKVKNTQRIIGYILFFFLTISPIILLFLSYVLKIVSTYYSIILIFVWGFSFALIYIYEITTKDSLINLFSLYAFIMSFIIPTFWIIKSQNAENILTGKSEIKVSFNTKNKPISTNDTLTFIGETKEFLFLRDLNNNGNLIYRKNNISDFKIIK